MSDHITCPHCGNQLAKGSTFCLNCGNRVPDEMRTLTSPSDSLSWDEPATSTSPQPEATAAEVEVPASTPSEDDEPYELPPVELSWDDVESPVETSAESSPEPTLESPPLIPIDDTIPTATPEMSSFEIETPEQVTEPTTHTPSSPPLRPIDDTIPPKASDMSLEDFAKATEISLDGDPFKEIEPPVAAEDMPFEEVEPPLVVDETTTDDAITHLFPEGCSETTPDFIDAVVGEAKRITISTPMTELDTPNCPNCGEVLTGDEYQYPAYVYSAMGRARLDSGLELLEKHEHEVAIESFEKAKKLFERADDQKMIDIVVRKIDEGYDAMGHAHYGLGERHIRDGEFEWAIVQFRKAREIYLLSTDKKLRTKCAERIRLAFLMWGKSLEDEADILSKQGDIRTALERYKQAAEKYRDGGDKKKLKGLEKKIRKA